MADGRKNNGGHKNSGRKSKAEELKVLDQGLNAIKKVYGSVETYWENIAEQSKESFPHLKLIHEHVYGKARETQDIHIKETPTITLKYLNGIYTEPDTGVPED